METKRKPLYRDEKNGKISGVCAGLGDYFDLDVTLIRVIFLALLICGSAGFWIYVVMWIVVDTKEVVMAREIKNNKTVKQDPKDDDDPFAKYD